MDRLFIASLKSILSNPSFDTKYLDKLPSELHERIQNLLLETKGEESNLLNKQNFINILPHLPGLTNLDLTSHSWLPAATLTKSASQWQNIRIIKMPRGRATDEFLIDLSRRPCASVLEVLDLSWNNSLSDRAFEGMAAFPNLKILKLTVCWHLSMAIAPHLAAKCSSLESLNLSYIPKIDDRFLSFLCDKRERKRNEEKEKEKEEKEEKKKEEEGEAETEEQNLPRLVKLSLNAGVYAWQSSARALHFLEHRKNIAEFQVLKIFNLEDDSANLAALEKTLQSCPLLSVIPRGVDYMSEEFKSMINTLPVTLRKMQGMIHSSEALEILCSRAPSLTALKLRDGDVAIDPLPLLSGLRRLNIARGRLTEGAVAKLFQTTSLTRLDLWARVEGVTTMEGFNSLIGQLPLLNHLEIAITSRAATIDPRSKSVHIKHPALEQLVYMDDHLKRITLDCPRLHACQLDAEELEVFYNDATLAEPATLFGYLAKHTPYLQKLVVQTMVRVPSSNTQEVDFGQLPRLKILNPNVPGLDAVSIRTLAKCRHLQELRLYDCAVTTESLEQMVGNCPHLSSLSLVNCPGVTSFDNCNSDTLCTIESGHGLGGVVSFKPKGMPNLHTLWLRGMVSLKEVELTNHVHLDDLLINNDGGTEITRVTIRNTPLLLKVVLGLDGMALDLESTGLEELSFYDTHKVEFMKVDCPNLSKLEFYESTGFTIHMVEELLQGHDKVTELKFNNMLSEEECLALADKYPSLEMIRWSEHRHVATLYPKETGEDRLIIKD